MPVMEIDFSPSDKRLQSLSDFLTSCILLSKQKGLKCRLKTGKVIIEGNKENILEVLHEVDHISYNTGAKNIRISLDMDKNFNAERLIQDEADFPGGKIQFNPT